MTVSASGYLAGVASAAAAIMSARAMRRTSEGTKDGAFESGHEDATGAVPSGVVPGCVAAEAEEIRDMAAMAAKNACVFITQDSSKLSPSPQFLLSEDEGEDAGGEAVKSEKPEARARQDLDQHLERVVADDG